MHYTNPNTPYDLLEPVTLGLIPINTTIMKLPNGVLLGIPEEGEAFYIVFEGLIPVSLYEDFIETTQTET